MVQDLSTHLLQLPSGIIQRPSTLCIGIRPSWQHAQNRNISEMGGVRPLIAEGGLGPPSSAPLMLQWAGSLGIPATTSGTSLIDMCPDETSLKPDPCQEWTQSK